MEVKATMTERSFNLVVPLAHEANDLFETANSYYGLLRQATHSHHDRARLSNELRRRGHCIAGDITKTFRRKAA
jgi:RNA-directed DNA polymerase